ncbi:TetR/AcrR family transcriptional regulator [Microbacterium sp. Root180]|uniref:TetR/AcrR family transcriptional regulator n=1 Tax=Microbacterium sp. Root180 TaxID=1736483 RepID=UPI0006FE007F|nr:TetR/AcrR family transcriptional regulator [Microbacterium sp. Root180]KRB38441.1 transcriptional regulator [Microbacterium sp. Root180]
MPADPAPDDAAPRTRGPYAKGLARRQQILDLAIDVFARRGSEGTSLRAIAQELGVSHAALTHYFTSREQLLVEVYREAERQNAAARPHAADASPVEIMTASAQRNHSVPGLVQLYSTLVAAALESGHPDATEFATERFARVRADLVQRVERNQAAGRLRTDVDPEAVASLVIAASDGLQAQWMLDDSVPQSGALDLLARLLAPDDSDGAAQD